MNACVEQGRIVLARRLARRVRHLRIAGESLLGGALPAATDVSVRVSESDAGGAERTYSVWRSDAREGSVDLCVTLHGRGAGSRWAERTDVGDMVTFRCSRAARITLDPAAGTHLFLGDETSVASAEALARVRPALAGLRAYFEVLTLEDRWPDAVLVDPSRIRWIVRNGRPGAALLAWLEASDLALDPGTTAYVTGEAWLCAMAHAYLVKNRGLPPHRVRALPYWKHRLAGI